MSLSTVITGLPLSLTGHFITMDLKEPFPQQHDSLLKAEKIKKKFGFFEGPMHRGR